MTRGKLIGIDHGLARIGVAICDESRIVARELTIIHRTSKIEDFAQLNALADEHGAVGFVVGLPVNHNAPPETYTQADRVRLWSSRFAETTPLPIVLWDEQLSSEDALALAKDRKRKPEDPIDDLAARIILQRYLDALSVGAAPEVVTHDD